MDCLVESDGDLVLFCELPIEFCLLVLCSFIFYFLTLKLSFTLCLDFNHNHCLPCRINKTQVLAASSLWIFVCFSIRSTCSRLLSISYVRSSDQRLSDVPIEYSFGLS